MSDQKFIANSEAVEHIASAARFLDGVRVEVVDDVVLVIRDGEAACAICPCDKLIVLDQDFGEEGREAMLATMAIDVEHAALSSQSLKARVALLGRADELPSSTIIVFQNSEAEIRDRPSSMDGIYFLHGDSPMSVVHIYIDMALNMARSKIADERRPTETPPPTEPPTEPTIEPATKPPADAPQDDAGAANKHEETAAANQNQPDAKPNIIISSPAGEAADDNAAGGRFNDIIKNSLASTDGLIASLEIIKRIIEISMASKTATFFQNELMQEDLCGEDGFLPAILAAAALEWSPIVVRGRGVGGFCVVLEENKNAITGYRALGLETSSSSILAIAVTNMVNNFTTKVGDQEIFHVEWAVKKFDAWLRHQGFAAKSIDELEALTDML